MYYARTIDDTMMHALNMLATQVTSGTQRTTQVIQHFLNYCASNQEATKLYKASDMILKVHSDAAYLIKPEARSRAGGFFYLGNDNSQTINGSILALANMIKNVVLSASEAKVAALFMDARLALPLSVALKELGHQQPAMEMITDNSTAEGILNGTMKQNRSKGMDMWYYWLRDRVSQGQFVITWKAGSVNLADCYTKHHPALHHKVLRPIYLHDEDCRLTL